MKCMTLAAVAALGAMSCTTAFADATASATLSDLTKNENGRRSVRELQP